jgi:hypothetical protein
MFINTFEIHGKFLVKVKQFALHPPENASLAYTYTALVTGHMLKGCA